MPEPVTAVRAQGFALLMVTSLAWGLNWPVMKLLMQDWPIWGFRVFAGGGAGLLLMALAARQGQRLWPARGEWPRLVPMAVLNMCSWSVVAPLSLLWLDAAEAAIISCTMPVWATMLAWPVLGERPTPARFAGLALGLAGVVLLMAGQLSGGPGSGGLGWAKWPGVACMLLTALMFAGGTVFTKRCPVGLAPFASLAWQLLLGVVPLVVLTLSFERLDIGAVQWMGWACLFYVTLVAQGLAYMAWFGALRRLPAGTTALGSLLVPVVGVLSSGLALGEPLGLRHLVALLLTSGGVVLAARR